jgi:glycosyltransferase involved in cell wall biosynthesis
MKLQIVVPIHNESASIEELALRIASVMDQNGKVQWRLLFVDDASSDESWAQILTVCRGYSRASACRLKRQRGKAFAWQVGFLLAPADYFVTIDGDLQNPPEEIPRIIEALTRGFELVNGCRTTRQDSSWRKAQQLLFGVAQLLLFGIWCADSNSGLKGFKGDFARSLRLRDGLHRFVIALSAHQGKRYTNIPVSHAPRASGVSNYSWTRIPISFMDLLTLRLRLWFPPRAPSPAKDDSFWLNEIAESINLERA